MAARKKSILKTDSTKSGSLCSAGSQARPKFTAFASKIAAWSGKPVVFLTACALVIL